MTFNLARIAWPGNLCWSRGSQVLSRQGTVVWRRLTLPVDALLAKLS